MNYKKDTYSFGDILLVNFGQHESHNDKCLDNKIAHEMKGVHLAVFLWSEKPLNVVIPITSFLNRGKIPKRLHGADFVVPAGTGCLHKDSIIRIHQLHTIDESKIIDLKGHFSSEIIEKLMTAIRYQLCYKVRA